MPCKTWYDLHVPLTLIHIVFALESDLQYKQCHCIAALFDFDVASHCPSEISVCDNLVSESCSTNNANTILTQTILLFHNVLFFFLLLVFFYSNILQFHHTNVMNNTFQFKWIKLNKILFIIYTIGSKSFISIYDVSDENYVFSSYI